MYKLIDDGVLRDGVAIPRDPRNADWREYLQWTAAGNVAEEADPVIAPGVVESVAIKPAPPAAPAVAKVSGVQPGAASKSVGPTWGRVLWSTIEFDGFPLVNASVRAVVHSGGVPNGNFILAEDGIYRFSAQIYVAPAESVSARISAYLGLFDRGTDGSGGALLHVANEEMPGGQHPSLALSCLVKHVGTRYYSFDWYYLDGGGVAGTMALQTGKQYCFASVERVG